MGIELQDDSLVELQGQIERITYTNDENGYTVARIKVYGRTELVTVVGAAFHRIGRKTDRSYQMCCWKQGYGNYRRTQALARPLSSTPS